ncbi:pyruvate, phosphate dikinase [Bartonella sp. CB169]|uniref:pyruvate, phosphate dikinase n=1 Tax=Bartonella sp. CB169 TaxID=3112257 RepID=UPI00300E6084
MAKWVYSFGDGSAEGSVSKVGLLGGKGANLAEMSNLGLPVPPGFTLTTEVCNFYYAHDKSYPKELRELVKQALKRVGEQTGREFGNKKKPLLLSVRSGARASMPGMMDTVLNLGMNDETVKAIALQANNERFACDSYRRFIQMYSSVVLGLEHSCFEKILDESKLRNGYVSDTEMTADDWKDIIVSYKAYVEETLGKPFPQDPEQQLWEAIGAVFSSWMTARAITYRRLHSIPENWGTAVNVQAMVFGNMGEDSATGVVFTRNPSTGKKELYGEFLVDAQGEDVVAGIRTPQNITEDARIIAASNKPSLEKIMPEAFLNLCQIARKLEQHYHDMQDIEFTIEKGKLWILQTRSGKRTTRAALKMAIEMVEEGLISSEEAVMRIDAQSLDQLLHPTLDPKAERFVIARGLPASPGAATGEIVFTSEEAETAWEEDRKVILVRIETSPEDIHGMHAAEGILTTRGGMTSHAAVVARGMGKPCISGAGSVQIDYKTGTMLASGQSFKKGDVITIDGGSGEIFKGEVAMLQPELCGDFAKLMEWADKLRRIRVRVNAETPSDARMGRSFGAEGIGLCRTEHMFFSGERLVAMREMILSSDESGRRKALNKLLPMQRLDFKELFEIMSGLPVTIRLLDPPLHEFLPKTDEEILCVAKAMGVSTEMLAKRVQELHEFNPMLGLRGCRLAITYPEIAEMQARAIFEAAAESTQKSESSVMLEIMVPLVALKSELDFVKSRIDQVASEVMKEKGSNIQYMVGTMIELPRAALRADEIAETAEFFSFGTNDLTQTTFGISRDDAAPFLETYFQKGLLEQDPFVSIDRDGVGELIAIAAQRGRSQRGKIKLGICGEHGGDPSSITLCEENNLDYVSCSPFRVPIARLAAAQSAIAKKT